jgi:hypothetical protein
MLRLFDQPVGLICFETDLLEDVARLPIHLGHLPASGLCWQWSSSRRYPARPDSAHLDLPMRRDITRLLPADLGALLADLIEHDTNDDRRSLELIGADVDLVAILQADVLSRQVLADFAEEHPPIRMVLVQPGDTGTVYIFLPHQPAAGIANLMAAWGIAPDRATQRAPYRRLHLARFEALFGLE